MGPVRFFFSNFLRKHRVRPSIIRYRTINSPGPRPFASAAVTISSLSPGRLQRAIQRVVARRAVGFRCFAESAEPPQTSSSGHSESGLLCDCNCSDRCGRQIDSIAVNIVGSKSRPGKSQQRVDITTIRYRRKSCLQLQYTQ